MPVVFIPSTWLSVLDSAHGGKNAVNFNNVKNLLGTYYFPKAVFIVEELLKQNPKELERQAYGELLKIALIKGGRFYKKLQQSILTFKSKVQPRRTTVSSLKKYNFQTKLRNQKQRDRSQAVPIQPFLQMAVKSKLEIIKRDPFEKKGERKKLNFGHTVGHVLEAVESLPHGTAVLHGLLFSLNWSYHKGFLSKKNLEEIRNLISFNECDLSFFGKVKRKGKKMPLKLFKSYLRQDKKHKDGFKVDFVFIKKPGEVFIKTVLEKDLIQEAKRQSLL